MKPLVFSAPLLVGLLGILASLAHTTAANASNYPPGYGVEQTCQTSGPVEVCAINQHYGSYPRLTIRYQGELIRSQYGRISTWVSLNGKSGTFRMRNFDYAETAALNAPHATMCFSHAQVFADPPPATPRPDFAWCSATTSGATTASLEWEVAPIPQAESELFTYARSEFGRANAWDIQLAFAADNGAWDSHDGANYSFRFEP